MLIGGNATALSLPIKECLVPTGINGPVAIFLTKDPQPLAADVVIQDPSSILSGPALAFIDTEADALGALVRKGAKPVESSDEITPDEANDALKSASGSISTETSSPTETSSDASATPTQDPASLSVAEPPVQVIGVTTIPA